MARQKGIIKLTGTMGGITYYKRGSKYFARKKTSLDKKRLKTDPAFASTMAYSNEFAEVARTSKKLRTAVSFLCPAATRKNTMLKFNRVLLKIKALDLASPRGECHVMRGLATAAGREMLTGFSFGEKNGKGDGLLRQVNAVAAQNMFRIMGLVPVRDFNFGKGATHVQLQGCLLQMNKKGEFALRTTESLVLKLDAKTTDAELKAGEPEGEGLVIYVLGIKFLQENGHGEMETMGEGLALITSVEPEPDSVQKDKGKRIKHRTFRMPRHLLYHGHNREQRLPAVTARGPFTGANQKSAFSSRASTPNNKDEGAALHECKRLQEAMKIISRSSRFCFLNSG